MPKGEAIIAEIDGIVEISRDGDTSHACASSSIEIYRDEYEVPKGAEVLVKNGQEVEPGTVAGALPKLPKTKEGARRRWH